MATREHVLDIARAQVGTLESPANSNCQKYSHDEGRPCEPWCADSVVWIMRDAGIKLPSESAYTPSMYQGFVNAGTAVHDIQGGLQPGDVLFFDFVSPFNTYGIQHVGIFEGYSSAGHCTTFEGNTSSGGGGSQDNGGGYFHRERPLSFIVGAGRPPYTPDAPAPIHQPTPAAVLPDYNPPLVMPSIVASLTAPTGGIWLLGQHGEIYAFWCKDYDAPNRHLEYWASDKVAVDLVASDNGQGYKVLSSDGGHFNYDGNAGPVGGHTKFDQPVVLPHIVSAAAAKSGGVRLLGEDGSLYAFNCADHDAPNRHPEYWPAGHPAAAKIHNNPADGSDGYTIYDSTGATYNYG